MHRPLVTVAIPAYNHAPFIAETIESVLSQSMADFELIIVDDASTDNTAAIAEGYVARDARVRVIRNPRNLGPGGTSEIWLKAAQGQYIATVASDDRFAPGKLAAQCAYLEKHPRDAMVGTGVTFIDEAGAVITHRRHFSANAFDTRPRDRGQWLRYFFNCGNTICASSLMLRTEAFRAHAHDHRLLQLQDYDSWVRLALAGYGIGILPEPLTDYRIRSHQANLSAPSPAVRARDLFEQIAVLSRYHALATIVDLQAMYLGEPGVLPAGVPEEAYVQHRLCLQAWNLGRPQHRMFALDNWYRMLGREEWRSGLETLGVNFKFLADKAAHYPLAEALAKTPYGMLGRCARAWLPSFLRSAMVRHIRKRRERIS